MYVLLSSATYLELLPARLATLPYGLDSNVTQLLANMLTKPSAFYYLPIVPCNLVSIKLLLLLLLLLSGCIANCVFIEEEQDRDLYKTLQQRIIRC